MRGNKATEQGLTLYQLLIALVALVIATSLDLAYQQGRHSQPIFADVERPRAE